MAEPPVSSTGSPYKYNSLEVSQSSAEPQQPIVSEFLDGGPVLSELPFGGLVEFNWPLSNDWFGFGLGDYFPPLTSGSPFLAAIIPPSPRRLLEYLAAGSVLLLGRKFLHMVNITSFSQKTTTSLLSCLHLVLRFQRGIDP